MANLIEGLREKIRRTVKDVIQDELVKQGIEEAVSANVEMPDGRSFQLHSDSHGVLEEEVLEGEEPKVTFSQSAKAGA